MNPFCKTTLDLISFIKQNLKTHNFEWTHTFIKKRKYITKKRNCFTVNFPIYKKPVKCKFG